MDEKPLIWTCRGNVPADSLRYEKEWVVEDDELKTVLWFRESWFFEDGELAKNNAHGYVANLKSPSDVTVGLQGVGMGGQQAVMQ